MRHISHILTFLILITGLAVKGQTEEYDDWLLQQKLPDWTIQTFKKLKLDSNYQLSDYINPFYLEADFNGDSKLDIAVAVEQKGTKKKGIIVFHGSTDKYFIFGAGTDLCTVETISTGWTFGKYIVTLTHTK